MLSFYLCQVKASLNIYLLACLQLGRPLCFENRTRFFSQCVTSALFLGNMLRARHYRFALSFRILSNQYVERSAYVKVFKFNRENERFERQTELQMFPLPSFRPPCWSPSDGLQHGVSILNTLIFSDTFCRITRVRNIAHPRNLGTLFIYYSSTKFQFLDSIY